MKADNYKPIDLTNKLYIKNMVCNRCIMVVEEELKKLHISPLSVELGEVTLAENMTEELKESIRTVLEPLGFELIDDKRVRIVEQVKNLIIDLVHHKDNLLKTNLSDYLTSQIHHDYSFLSKLFSEVTDTTIEKYFIAQKIERVKELLVYDELSLKEIAELLNYSSVSHLSTQFKTVTGMTPTYYKSIKGHKRKTLDQV